MKFLDLDGDVYAFETLEQLVDMIKDEDYIITLNLKKKGKIRKNVMNL